ncbi:MAG: ferredoxin family protein, partial [Pirellulales bacterium]
MSATLLPPRVVVYEGRGSVPLAKNDRVKLFANLLDRGYAVTLAGQGAATAAPDGAFVVVGCFAEQSLEVVGGDVTVCDITGVPIDDVVHEVERARGSRQMNRPEKFAVKDSSDEKEWKPWFPVIDMERCTNCMQCLSFCLFDVYGVSDDHHLKVENPANCKVNCPACSRVCPDVAIMFPKYHAGPIDGGPVSDTDVTREKMKVDISALLGGDIY